MSLRLRLADWVISFCRLVQGRKVRLLRFCRLSAAKSMVGPLCLVRLSGPVNGRGGVCRDLRQDLRRIGELGVGCVIWYV